MDPDFARPERVEMTAREVSPREGRPRSLASVVVDPYENTLRYSLHRDVADTAVQIHGYVPRGWATDPIFTLPRGTRSGVWIYPEADEKNLLAGLAYLQIQPAGRARKPIRAQIEQKVLPKPVFEDFVTVTLLAGKCQGKITVTGLLEDVPMEMEPAQVILARTPARDREDGRREQEIGCAVRVGGASIPGIGNVEIGMFGVRNPGHIISMKAGSDFPARMTLDVRKHYMTPSGVFYRDNEEFFADDIERFPPFGVRFTPVDEIAPLREEKTGEVVGRITLEWLVPLCYADSSNFPSEALAHARIEEDAASA